MIKAVAQKVIPVSLDCRRKVTPAASSVSLSVAERRPE